MIVSDDGFDRATQRVAIEFNRLLPNLRIIDGPRWGLAANRNSCIDAATSEYLLYLDDDASLDENFLERALPEVSPTRVVTGFEHRSGQVIRPTNPGFLGFLEERPEGDLFSIVINATIFPTQFLKSSYFDEFFRYGCEETEITFAARAAGLEIVEIPAGNHHDHSPLGRERYATDAARSRAYFSTRRYLRYQRRPFLYAAYVVAATANAAVHGLRSRGPWRAVQLVRATTEGAAAALRTPARRRLSGRGRAKKLRVSIVVPTWRRAAQLEACLEAITRLRRQPDEVVVVRRRQDSPAADLIERFAADLRIAAVVVEEPGQVAALRAGAAAAHGDVVAFIDDDTVPRSSWLDFLLPPYADPSVAAVGGRDSIYPDGGTKARMTATVGRVRWFGRVVGNHHLGTGIAREVDVLKGANMSVRRGLLSFPEGLRGDGAELCNDMAMSLALRSAGWKLIYDPRAEVEHRPAPRTEGDARAPESKEAFASMVFNRTYVTASLCPRRSLQLAYGMLIGDRSRPGLGRVLAAAVLRDDSLRGVLFPSLTAQWQAWRAARSEPLRMYGLEDRRHGAAL